MRAGAQVLGDFKLLFGGDEQDKTVDEMPNKTDKTQKNVT